MLFSYASCDDLDAATAEDLVKRLTDIGVAAGKGQGIIFSHGEVIRTVPEEQIVEALFEEIAKL